MRFATDAPLHFAPKDGQTEFCAPITNTNVISTFDLSYTVVRGIDATAPIVATGAYAVSWNRGMVPDPYGAEYQWCAADGPGSTPCAAMRAIGTTPLQWCLFKAQPGTALRVGMRLWAAPEPSPKQYQITTEASWAGGAQPIVLVVPPVRKPDQLTFNVTNGTIPLDLVLEAGTVDDDTIHLKMHGVSVTGTLEPGFGSDFDVDVRVRVASGNNTCP